MESSNLEQLFLKILDQHKKQVYRVCWGFTNNVHDVEDLFQEVVLNLWKGIPKFRKESAYSTWIYRITINTCLLWQKKSKKIKELKSQIKPLTIASEKIEQTDTKSDILILKNAIQQLEKVDRSIILLVMEGFSYKEIADITGFKTSHVGVKINRIKSKLKILIHQ